MKLFTNRYFLLGNLLLILLAIPITLFVIRRQQTLQGSAAPLTTLSIEPNAITKTVCEDPISMDVMVDPDKNLVSIVDLYVVYDATKLELSKIVPNDTAFPLTLRGPTYESGKANISLSIGSDVTKAIQSKTKVATLNFKPKAATTGGSVRVSVDQTKSRVFSLNRGIDEPGENVLLNALGSNVTINQQDCTNVTRTPTPSGPTASVPPGSTATPTTRPGTSVTPGGGTGTQPTPTTPGGTGGESNPTLSPGQPTASPTATLASNQPPVCTSFNVDRVTTGNAPYSIVFTAVGNDPDGTISKATFNFGEGPAQDIAQGGGIGTKNVTIPVSHTYNTAGTYRATAALIDNAGATSSATVCTQTITINPAPTTPDTGGSPGGKGGVVNPTPTIEKPGSALMTVGIIGGVILTILGAAFFLAL